MKELEENFYSNFSVLISEALSEFCKERLKSVSEDIPLPVLTAFSGGADSRVLLELVSRYEKLAKENPEFIKIKQVACHVDHSLREGSEEEVLHIQKVCTELKVPLFLCKLPEKPKQANLEAWAREKRYEFFKRVASYFKASFLLTAHHLDDQAETVLFRLATGRLLTSKNSIVEKEKFLESFSEKLSNDISSRESVLLRPLLSFRSNDIKSFAVSEKLDWVEDETNSDLKRSRNKIRHEVIPYLEKNLSSSFSKQAAAYAKQASLDETFLESLVQKMELEKVDTEFFKSIDPAIRWRVLRKLAAKEAGENAYKVGYEKWVKLSAKLLNSEKISELELGFGVCIKKLRGEKKHLISFYSKNNN